MNLDASSGTRIDSGGVTRSGLVTVARMQLDHVEEVSRLERRCCPLPWSTAAYVTEIGNPAAHYIVAIAPSGAIVGYAGMWVIMDEAHLTTIAVDPDWRGRRIGDILLRELLVAGLARGVDRATLEVREGNFVARSLYHQYRFEGVAIRKNYYGDNGENAIIMWANNMRSDSYQELLDSRAQLHARDAADS